MKQAPLSSYWLTDDPRHAAFVKQRCLIEPRRNGLCSLDQQ